MGFYAAERQRSDRISILHALQTPPLPYLWRRKCPFYAPGANFRNFLTTLHLPIIYIIIYMEPLGAKFGNTEQAEVRTLSTFLPSSAKLRNISRPFYIHNSLLVRTLGTFLRHFQGSAMIIGSRNRFRSRSPHLMKTFQVCRCEL